MLLILQDHVSLHALPIPNILSIIPSILSKIDVSHNAQIIPFKIAHYSVSNLKIAPMANMEIVAQQNVSKIAQLFQEYKPTLIKILLLKCVFMSAQQISMPKI